MEGGALSWDEGCWWAIWTARRKRTDSVRERERELGILNEAFSSCSGGLIICDVGCPDARVGSHRDPRGHHRRDRVSGARSTCLFFTACRSPPVLCTSPGLSGSDSLVRPIPPLPLLSFLLPLSNYLLVSSPAGRSFFEKTTRARTRPTPLSQKARSLPHPNRRYSSTFVCFSPFNFSTHEISIHETSFFFSPSISNIYPPCMCPIRIMSFPVLSSPACISLHPSNGFLSIPPGLSSTCFSHPIRPFQNLLYPKPFAPADLLLLE